MKNYNFAVERTIIKVLSQSSLYLDGSYNKYAIYENLAIRRIDKPLYLLLDNKNLIRLYGVTLSDVQDDDKEYILSKDYISDPKTVKEFDMLCGSKVISIEELSENKYEPEDEKAEYNYSYNNLASTNTPTSLLIVFDNGIRLISSTFFDYCNIEIIENEIRT